MSPGTNDNFYVMGESSPLSALSSTAFSTTDTFNSSCCSGGGLLWNNQPQKNNTTTAATISSSSSVVAAAAATKSRGGSNYVAAAAFQASDSEYTDNNDDFIVDLAKEMNELSVEEREKVLDDLHGVGKVHDETPEYVQECTQQLDRVISNEIANKKRIDYNQAMFLRPALSSNTSFKLMFLRAEYFDTTKAAHRMVKYFEQKRELFGEDKVAKEILLEDLDEDDLLVYKSGFLVDLLIKDQTGRRVVFCDLKRFDCDRMSVQSALRCFWYLLTTTSADDISQKKGNCGIVNAFEAAQYISTNTHGTRKLAEIVLKCGYIFKSCLPCRLTSYHICYNDPRMEFWVHTVRVAVGRDTRLRLRTHIGSALEIEYDLMTFGIRCEGLLQRTQTDYEKAFEKYVQHRQMVEEAYREQKLQEESLSGVIAYPNPSDVLVGRGQPYRDYPGSLLWNRLICSELDRYVQSSTRFEKTCISMDVVKTIQDDTHGRFLERTPNGWKILDDLAAREKTAIAFRSRVKTGAGSQELLSRLKTPPPLSSSNANAITKRQRINY